MKSLDKKMVLKDSLEHQMAVSSPRDCKSPSEMSHASTACSPEPEPSSCKPAESTNAENVKISLSLSPEMLEQIGNGGEIRFALHLQQESGIVDNVDWQPDTPATTIAAQNTEGCWDSISPVSRQNDARETVAVSQAFVGGLAPSTADVMGMSDDELIAMLAGCASAPAKAGVALDDGPSIRAEAQHDTVLYVGDSDESGDASAAECALEHLEGFGNPLHPDALNTLVCDSLTHDDDQHRLWSEDLLSFC